MPRGRLSEPPTYWRRRRLLDQAQNNLGYTEIRLVMMTSFAFIFGLLPLVIAGGVCDRSD